MSLGKLPLDAGASKPVFIACVFSLHGWGLLEALLLASHAMPRAHLVVAVYGSLFTFLACRASWRHHGTLARMAEALRWPRRSLVPSDLASAALLVLCGYVLGALVGTSLLLMGVAAMSLALVPWMRFAFCRDYFVAACALMCLGAGTAAITGAGSFHTLSVSMAAWILWASSLIAVFRGGARSARMRLAGTTTSGMHIAGSSTPGADRPLRAAKRGRQSGAFAIMTAPLLLVLIGFCALALEIGQVYNRKVDMSGFAKAVALAAARELDGTPEGITAAIREATATAGRFRYQHFADGHSVEWNNLALSFSNTASRTGNWIPAATAGASAANLYFAKVDTAALTDSSGTIKTIFIRILSGGATQVTVSDSAVAGRTSVNVTPIAICAMGDAAVGRSATGSSGTVTELVQYGFRRGVSYDLMQLNPNGTTAVSYGVNPVSAPGGTSTAFNTGILGSFVCTGTMWIPRIKGGNIHVTPLPTILPLASLYAQLNSRFDYYGGNACNPNGAPPDYNIKAYTYDVASAVRWMNPTSGRRSALASTAGNRLATVADVAGPPSAPGDYGPLWAYAKAVKAPTPLTAPEPSTGYAVFGTGDWSTIYKSGPTASNYPSSSPYQSISTASGNYAAPTAANLELSSLQRRVLNLPLLDCSTSTPSGANTEASVAAIGKFFMTVPATSTSLIAEFAGVVPEKSLARQVSLYP